MSYKHARITTTYPQPDGSLKIETMSYHEELAAMKVEVQQSNRTTKDTFMADLIRCVRPISDGTTRELTLSIECNIHGEPKLIVQTWSVKKEKYRP